ncbi:MAG: tetratricopeptide repeat protein, partial [Dinghuibacter sp.]|nr:tetratricopeptide repeat protein [Dinghuibacter sp.]
MKTGTIIILYLLIKYQLPAQAMQTGRVIIRTPETKPLAYVQIQAKGALLTSSDQEGRFTLEYTEKKPGQPIDITNVNKKGYIWINETETKNRYIGYDGLKSFDIVMELETIVKAREIKITEGITRKSINSINSKIKALEAKVQKENSRDAQIEQEIAFLKKWLKEELPKEIEKIASKYSRVDKESATPQLKTLIQLIEQGDVDAAIASAEQQDVWGEADKLILRKKNETNTDSLNELEEQIKQQVRLFELLAKLYLTRQDIEETDRCYNKLLELNPDDIEQIKEISIYYRSTGRYFEALKLYDHLLSLPIEERIRVRIHLLKGHIFSQMGKTDSALYYYNIHIEKSKELSASDINNPTYLRELALAHRNIGHQHKKNEEYGKALTEYHVALRLLESVCKQLPATDLSCCDWAESYTNIGNIYQYSIRYDSALYCYQKGKELLEGLNNNPSSRSISETPLANVYYYLGNFYILLKDYALAKYYFNKCLVLYEQGYTKSPLNEIGASNLAQVYNEMGNVLRLTKDNPGAIKLHQKSIQLYESISKQNPSNRANMYHLSVAYQNLSISYLVEANYPLAADYADRGYAFVDDLFRQDSGNKQYHLL